MTLLLVALEDVGLGKRIKCSVGMMTRRRPRGQELGGERIVHVITSAIRGRQGQTEQALAGSPR
jgi:hypothetical protein